MMTMSPNIANLLVYILLLTGVLSISTDLLCPSDNNNCTCIKHPSYLEFQCPSQKDHKTEIHVKPNDSEIKIECRTDDVHYGNPNMFPNITAGEFGSLILQNCTLPNQDFPRLLNQLGLNRQNLKVFEVSYIKDSSTSIENITRDTLAGFESIHKLTFTQNYRSIPEDFLENFPNLTELVMTFNNLKNINFNIKKNPKLRELNLGGNSISSIPKGWFKNSNQMEILDLDNNLFSEISSEMFEGLDKLSLLDLTSNNIADLDLSLSKLPNLKQLYLNNNSLKKLTRDVFINNPQLELVRLPVQPNLTVDDYLFANLRKLKEVWLYEAHLTSVPEHLFENCTNLRVINLRDNNLSNLPAGLFKGLEKLEQLYLQRNRLHKLEAGSLNDLTAITTLHLSGNNLSELAPGLFGTLETLNTLKLSENNISSISDVINAFYFGDRISKYNINTLDLSHNLINNSSSLVAMIKMLNLSNLNLDHNLIKNIKFTSATPVSSEEYRNFINIIPLDTRDLLNDISPVTISIENNPLICDCHNYDLFTYYQYSKSTQMSKIKFEPNNKLKCAGPEQLKNQYLPQLKPEQFTCAWNQTYQNCPGNCSCSYRPYDTARVVNCSYRNFQNAPIITYPALKMNYNQTEVHLEGNMLELAPTPDINGYENVTKLYLERNRIRRIEWAPPEISVLHLDYNRIEELSSDFLSILNHSSSLRKLTLANNPWRCECSTGELQGFLRENNLRVDSTKVQCKNSEVLLINQDVCPPFNPQILALIIALLCTVCALAVLIATYFYYQNEIKVWLYAKNLCLWFVTEEELDKDKTYDIFLSYSHQDEQFVEHKLLKELESGSRPYKVCVHVRDFTPGEFIDTQVIRSVEESRRTLVILSNNFVESVWGQMEFKAAHSQAMKDRRARVVVVIYGELDEEKLDDDLKSYLKTNTYVKWGEPYFWNKLHYALPHRRCKLKGKHQQKLEQVMGKIDDKFELVSGAQKNSTRPVSLDASLLKSHPLSFNLAVFQTPPAEVEGTG